MSVARMIISAVLVEAGVPVSIGSWDLWSCRDASRGDCEAEWRFERSAERSGDPGAVDGPGVDHGRRVGAKVARGAEITLE